MTDLFDLEEEKGSNWDPPAHERSYFRHSSSGDLGWMVRRDGEDHIKYDRPMQDLTKPYRQGEWKPENRPYPLTVTQMAMVAFEADKRLCFFLGLQSKTKMDWQALTDRERDMWVNGGPEVPERRAILYNAIMDGLKGCEV